MKSTRAFKSVPIAAALVAAAFATAAYANPINDVLARNAAQQARIENDLAAGRIDPLRAAQVQQRAAEVYRLQAQVLADAGTDQQEQLRQAQRDLAGAITWAENHPARDRGDAMDRVHLRVASMRDAEQQRLIARGFASGRLSATEVASLEAAQADIVGAEAEARNNGHESVEVARSIQGEQDVQDYAIRKDPSVDVLTASSN